MAEYMQLDIVTPEKSILSRKVTEVVAPGSEGEFGVLYGHTPFLTTLKPGRILAKTEDRDILIAVSGGFAEVTANKIIVLAESAQLAEDINLQEVRAELEMLEDKFKGMDKDDPDYYKVQDRMAKTRVRVKVAETSILD